MPDIAVGTVSAANYPAWVEVMCEENHYDPDNEEEEGPEEFANRMHQEEIDEKIAEVAGDAWKHGFDVAMAGAEDKYVTSNPPPAGYDYSPAREDLVAEFKEK